VNSGDNPTPIIKEAADKTRQAISEGVDRIKQLETVEA